MLGKYIKVDGVLYPNPSATSIAYENKERVNESEAGTDLVSAKRLQKVSITFSYQVTSHWREIIKNDAMKLGVILEFNGKEYQGRLRVTNDVLAPNSENVSVTDGLWTMTVIFTER